MKHVQALIFLLLTALMVNSALGRIRPLPPPVIKVEYRQDEQAVSVFQADIKTRVLGPLAETEMTLVFRNPNRRTMEGELSCPLPPGATVQGYALDINGRLVDGVPVPKEKARAVFEEEVRNQVDPGLAEWSGGNVFKTRIYPIPGQGTRTIKLRYSTVLPENEQGAYTLQIPMNFKQKLDFINLRIEVQGDRKPVVTSSALSNVEFGNWRNAYLAEKEWKDLTLTEDLIIALPRPEAATAEVKVYTEAADGKHYAALLVPKPNVAERDLIKAPYVTLIWDASSSMKGADVGKFIEFLKLLLSKEKPDVKTVIHLHILRNTVQPTAKVEVTPDNLGELGKILRDIDYDGGTCSWSTVSQTLRKMNTYTFSILVSDGMVNFSEAPGAEGRCNLAVGLTSKKDVYAFSRTGTPFIDLTAQTAEQALKQARCSEVTLTGKAEFLQHFCKYDVPGLPGNMALYLAELNAETPREGMVMMADKEYAVNIDTAQAPAGTLLRSLYAQARLQSLLAQAPGKDRDQRIKQLGMEYGVVTPGTSLLVLDNLEQYLRYEIRPPASAPEMRAHYDRMMAQRAKDKKKANQDAARTRLENCLKSWKEWQTWYAKDFGKYDGKKFQGFMGDDVAPAGAPIPRSLRAARVEADADWDEGNDPFCAEQDDAPVCNEAPARRGSQAYITPYDENRARMLAEVDCAWASPESSGREAKVDDAASAGPVLKLKAWDSKAPYLTALDAAENPFKVYMKLKEEHGANPGFYMDCSDWFTKKGDKATALQVLSNLAEMDSESRAMLRMLGYKLRYMGNLKKARFIFKTVKNLFPEEPQSYRDLALVVEELGKFQRAFDLYKEVLTRPMQERFQGVENIVLVEMNRLLARAKAARAEVDTRGLDKAFFCPVDVDMRVVINWDTDASDMDLWVTDCTGEKCFYSHQRTRWGGRISRDVTGGYGPEEYLVRKAIPGTYKVQTHYFGTHSAKMLAPVTLYAEVYTNYGRRNELRQTLVFRLDGQDKVVHVGDMGYEDPRAPQTRDYQVKAGETRQAIAEKELGDKAKTAEIIRLNPALKDREPHTGEMIKLPK